MPRQRYSRVSFAPMLASALGFLSLLLATTQVIAVDSAIKEHHNMRSLQDEQNIVENIQLELDGINSLLSQPETVQFEVIMSNWMDNFIERGGAAGRVTGFSSTVTMQSQSLVNGGIRITYEVLTVYTPTTPNVRAEDLVVLPFLNIFFNAGLGAALRDQIPALEPLPKRTIRIPQILGPTLIPTSSPNVFSGATGITGAPIGSINGAPIVVAPPVAFPTTEPTQAPQSMAPISMAPISLAPISLASISLAPISLAPVSLAPVSLAPVSSVPVSSAPVSLAPVSLAPESMALESLAPVSFAPVSLTPASLTPVSSAPIAAAPILVAGPAPTGSPVVLPTIEGTAVSVLVRDVVIDYPRGLQMNSDEQEVWESVTKEWWETFYAGTTTTTLQDVQANFDLKSQIFTETGNTVVCDVEMQYIDFEELDDPNIVVLQPFLSDSSGYLDELRSKDLTAFSIAEQPIGVVIGDVPALERGGRNSGLIAAILVILILILIAAGLYAYFNVRAKERRRTALPPDTPLEHAKVTPYTSAAAVKGADTSTLGGGSDPFSNKEDAQSDDYMKDNQSYDLNSLATSNFDYDKVGNTRRTKASSSGPGDASSMASSKSYPESDDMHVQEDQFVIYAPAGRLGLVVDNPDEGPPVIHSIKPDSVLIDQILVGDRLIGVDEVDVSSLSPVKVSKLISRRSSNPLRKLTLTRRKETDEREVLSLGRTNDSNMDTMSRLSGMESGVDTMSRMSGGAESGVDSMSRMSGIDTDAEGEGDQLFSSDDDETSFVGSMSRVSGDSRS